MGRSESTLTLILGGARSGKSSYAEALAAELGGPVLFVATAEALDDEMQARVAAHRARRPVEWATLEAPTGVGAALASSPVARGADVILVDCLTLLVSNAILAGERDAGELEAEEAWARVRAEIEALIDVQTASGAHLIIVSNEVGLGVVPPYSLGRIYRDCLGWANQRLARTANRAILMVAGLPVDLMALPLALLD